MYLSTGIFLIEMGKLYMPRTGLISAGVIEIITNYNYWILLPAGNKLLLPVQNIFLLILVKMEQK